MRGGLNLGLCVIDFHSKLLAPFATPFSCIIKKKKKKTTGLQIIGLGMNPDSNTYLLCDLEKVT